MLIRFRTATETVAVAQLGGEAGLDFSRFDVCRGALDHFVMRVGAGDDGGRALAAVSFWSSDKPSEPIGLGL